MDNLLNDILTAIEVLSSGKFKEPEEAVNELTSKGFSRLQSEKFVFSVPLAFGRKVIKQLGVGNFSDEFVVETSDNKKIELKIKDNEIYNISSLIADKTFSEGYLTREVFKSTVSWSAELKSANDLLRASDDIRGAEVLTPVWFSRLEAKYWLND